MTAEIIEYEMVAKPTTLCLPDEVEPDYKWGAFQKERQRNNAAQKQRLWAYVRHHGL